MKILDWTFDDPAENLACDEALLDLCEEGRGGEVLRFWEPRRPFVVLGYSNKPETETHFEACRREGVPVLRRASGGGTVLQGPGCLNYALVLKAPGGKPGLTGANKLVMERHRDAMAALLGREVAVEGHTDLCAGGKKFSGNAQRRRRESFLFHGTFLLHFDLEAVSRALPLPSLRPAYRKDRGHGEFLMNLGIPAAAVKAALIAAWGAGGAADAPVEASRRLAQTVNSRSPFPSL